MDNTKTLKRIWSLFLTLALVITMSVTALPSYAADGGTISVKFNPGVALTEDTNFKLYKVGEFGRDENDNVTIEPLAPFSSSGVNMNIAVPKTEEEKAEGSEWHQAWLDAASQIANWINTPGEGKNIPDPVWGEKALSKSEDYQTLKDDDGNAQFFSRGIYLLMGDEQRVGHQYWSPVPVLIMVLNGETKFDIVNANLKMSSRPVVYEHTVFKDWQDDGHTAARPETVNVDIFYGETKIDTVTLGEGEGGIGSWSYTWYSQEAENRIYTSKDPEDKDAEGVSTQNLNEGNNFTLALPEGEASWKVDESQTAADKEKIKYYTRTITYSGQQEAEGDEAGTEGDDTASDDAAGEDTPAADDRSETITISNTFSTAELTINKDLQSYINQEDANATVVFEIKGMINGIEKPVYQNSVGMTFKGPGQQRIVLDNLPVNLDSLTVEEVYSTNYNLVGDKPEVTLSVDDNGKKHYSISFVNEHKPGPPTYNTGIVNVYDSNGEYTPKDDTSDIYKVELPN